MVQKNRFLPVLLLVLAMAVTLAGCEEEYQSSETSDSGRPFVIHVLNNEGTRG